MTRRRNGSALVQRTQKRLRPVVPRLDEMADGLPAPASEPDAATVEALARVQRADGGRLADPTSAAILGRLGGHAKAKRDRALAEVPTLARRLGLREIAASDFAPYLDDAAELAAHEQDRLAQTVGGGVCGTGPAIIVASAALQIAGSRFAFAQGDLITGSRLADAARANLISAQDLCAREAKARPRPPAPWLLADPQSADDDADDAEPDDGDENASAPDVGGAATESEDR